MFGLVNCNASILARESTDPQLFFVRSLVKIWLWPIITFFGVTGNILTIVVLTKRRMIMSSTNNYLIALALVDIAYLILTLILNTSQHPCFAGATLSDILMVICRPIADFSSNTSVWITVTFTVERWVAITYPLQSRTWCTVNRARKIIIGVICAALICTSPSAFEMKLVRVMEIKNSTNTSRIRAKPTALGDSPLYHQIYFNFVTFAIIWIPLLFLVILNTMLILSVRRSKQDERQNSDGIQLRKHNRGNQGEQRKTTIMLIAVVIVFTVCQIPQAISLTVQSFFPIFAQTSKVLIYNNFANCLVAVNASINFLLYCCFSDRFRSTFRLSFTVLHKYCANFIEPNWNYTTGNTKYSISLENVSSTYPYGHSNSSLQGPVLNSRLSNMSNDLEQKLLKKTSSNTSQGQPRLSNINHPSRTSSTLKLSKIDECNSKQLVVTQNAEMNSTTTGIMKNSSSAHQSTLTLAVDFPITDSSVQKKNPLRSSTVSFTAETICPKSYSSSTDTLNRSGHKNSSIDRFKRPGSVTTNHRKIRSTLHPIYHSHRVLNTNPAEQIWIKRRLSNETVKHLINEQKAFLSKEILDVTV